MSGKGPDRSEALGGSPPDAPAAGRDAEAPTTQPAGFPGLAVLQGLVRDCAAAGVERRVLLLRADLLPPRLARPHHLRLMRDALDPLLSAERARLHDLPNGCLAVSWRGPAPARLQQSLEAVEHLFGIGFRIEPALVRRLVRLFDLPRDGTELLAAAGAGDDAETKPRRRQVIPATPLLAPLDAAALATMERELAAADMTRFARRKPVHRLDGSQVRLAWERRCLSIPELADTLVPGRNIRADAWLFRRLTRVLDSRVLALLSAPLELHRAGPFSLGLNVGSVLSPEFLRFDSALPSRLRGRVVLEVQPADVLADPAAFAFARNFAHARGYRLLLRGVTAAALPMLCLPPMELDYVQLRWSPELVRAAPATLQAGGAEWVLSRADDDDALRWGRDQGFSLFEGRALAATA